jgi:flagellum-specific peptidoglycan hydrolase FlgJ
MSHQPPAQEVAAAQAAARKWRVPASVQLAQWALESGWGAHEPEGSNNPFGVKARVNGYGVPVDPFVEGATTEVVDGKVQHIAAPFRKFASLEDAFDHHAELLATAKVYAPAMAVVASPNAFAMALTGRYATAPGYGALLIAVMKGSNLYQYDAPPPPTAAVAKAA